MDERVGVRYSVTSESIEPPYVHKKLPLAVFPRGGKFNTHFIRCEFADGSSHKQ